MTLRITMVTIDSPNPHELATWWAAQIGGQVDGSWEDHFYIVRSVDGGPRLGFQRVADPTPGKNRVHIDLAATVDLEDEIARLIEAGAEEIARHNFEHSGWVVMSDPEGNHFCVSQH